MSLRTERWTAVLVQSAPVWLGGPVWLALAGSNYMYLFAPGLFMLAAGLIVALIARFAAQGFVRKQAAQSLRFHLWVLLAVPIWALGFPIAAMFDAPNPTMDHPPVIFQTVLGIGAFAFGLVLPIVEVIRVFIGVAEARRGPTEWIQPPTA